MSGVDLHMHSFFSDGELSPVELVECAKVQGLHTIAITDHDNIDAYPFAQQIAQQHQIRLIQGVEISSYWQRKTTQKSYTMHIVALDMQHIEPMNQLLAQQKQQRATRALLICEKLQQILKTDFLPDVRLMVDGHDERITRSHIAKVLVKRNVVTRMQQAFDRFLKEGKRAYVPFMGVEMSDAIKIIHTCQGFAVLAHPTKYDLSATNVRQMIEQFAQAGGDAIELPPEREPPATRQMIDRLITDYDLKISIGSDFHGQHMSWLKLGHVPRVNENQTGIWHDFQTPI